MTRDAPAPFYQADAVERVAVNLFHGWGYNFYRRENQLRADDLTVRARVSALLGAARASLEAAESAHRREHLPPPTRERPRPDPQAMQGAQALERLGREIGALEGAIRALPAPEADRMTQRRRDEADTLARLLLLDQALAARAEMLRAALSEADAPWILGHAADLRDALAELRQAVQARHDLLAT
ncbi:MAG: hypothetical protein ACRYG6_02565 [Janthinobacterium lividum]